MSRIRSHHPSSLLLVGLQLAFLLHFLYLYAVLVVLMLKMESTGDPQTGRRRGSNDVEVENRVAKR